MDYFHLNFHFRLFDGYDGRNVENYKNSLSLIFNIKCLTAAAEECWNVVEWGIVEILRLADIIRSNGKESFCTQF